MYSFRNPFFTPNTPANRRYFNNYYRNFPPTQNTIRNSPYEASNTIKEKCASFKDHNEYTKENPFLHSTSDNDSKESEDRNILHTEIEKEIFEILGLKIYFDDLLIICILIFLYQEGVTDKYLFIALILLLLNG